MKVQINCITKPYIDKSKLGLLSELSETLSPEEYMIYCARVSSPDNRLNHETAPGLLKYLIDHKHWSPFEMISIGFEIETSRAIAQQMLRHRSFSFQEFSQRYAKVSEIEPVELRMRAEINRQSSTTLCDDMVLEDHVNDHLRRSMELYDTLVDAGIAKECARFVLPLTTRTTIVQHGTLRSWIHWLEQRCDEHAQREIQLIALEVRSQLSIICPWTAKALEWM